MIEEYIRKSVAKKKYGISYTILRKWILMGLVKTEMSGFLVNKEDIEKAITRPKIKSGRPFAKTENQE